MRGGFRPLALACLLFPFALGLSPAVSAQFCDRACLQSFADLFLGGLQARDPTGLPLSPELRYTENGQDIALGDGLWKTFSRNSSYRLYAADPQAGQVAFLGVIEENGTPVIAHFRLRIENRQITEAEALLARNAAVAELENLRRPYPVFTEALSSDQRSTREEMVRIADSYFEGLDTANSGAGVPFHPACLRQENGGIMANSPEPEASPMQKLGCAAQFDTGFSTIVTEVRERRYMVLDEERGLVYAVVFFDHDGTPRTMGTAEGGTKPVGAPFNRPLTFMIGELFKIEEGRIRQIEAVVIEVPYGMPSGWDGTDLVSLGQL